MKKVLIIAYFYPPIKAIGTLRSVKFAKYLQSFGWDPYILTVEAPGYSEDGQFQNTCKVYRTKYFDLVGNLSGLFIKKKIGQPPYQQLVQACNANRLKQFAVDMFRDFLCFPDAQVGWFKYAVRKGIEIIKNENIDMVFSTSAPVTSHLIASKLKNKCKIPWVADFRDLWTQNPYYRRNWLLFWFEKIIERRIISNADYLVTVSEPWAEALSELHGLDKRVAVISNGFDEDDYLFEAPIRKEFVVTYTGNFFGWRNPEPLFVAISNLLRKELIAPKELILRFYGRDVLNVLPLSEKYNIRDLIEFNLEVSFKEAIVKQKESTILLLVESVDKKSIGTCPGKVFEYLGAKRPILAIGAVGGSMDKLLQETKAGILENDPSKIEKVLLCWIKEFRRNGSVPFCGASELINGYSRKNATAKLSEVFNAILKGKDMLCAG